MADRFILTGPPGAGKTTILEGLSRAGYVVVAEAATDAIAVWQQRGIAEPWMRPEFMDYIAGIQRDRLKIDDRVQFYDRSPICTLVLARWLGHPLTEGLKQELERVEREHAYHRDVFYVESLGFVTPTEARRISYVDSLRFGELHRQVYLEYGYRLIDIPAEPADERVARIRTHVSRYFDKSA